MLSPASNYGRYLQDVPNDYSRRPQPVSQRAASPASSVCLQPAAGVKFRINRSPEQSFGAQMKNWNVAYIKESVYEAGLRGRDAGFLIRAVHGTVAARA